MYICTKCGGTSVESLQWTDLNTGEVDTESETGEYYCRDCGAHTDVEWKASLLDDLDDVEISAHPTEKPETNSDE